MPEPGLAARLAGVVLRLVLLCAGLLLAAGILFMLLVLGAVWGLRYAWARLTGRPVTPWVMRVDPRAAWNRYAGGPAMAPRGRSDARRELGDVTDVEPK